MSNERLDPRWATFGAKTSADEVVQGLDLSALRVVVTGANTGIGFETARALASAGAKVVLGCRDEARGREAAARIAKRHPGRSAEFSVLDLASLASVRAFAQREGQAKLDVLVCNAGVFNPRYLETHEGFEHTVGVSHVGHFLLVRELLPRLLEGGGGRVVMVSSESHRHPKTLDFARFPLTSENYSAWVAYGQAKLCNLLLAKELDRRYRAQGLAACSLHPGTLVTTEIGRGSLLTRVGMALVSPFTKSAAQGAATSVVCALHPDPSWLGGRYFSDCAPRRNSREGDDAEVARRLWEVTERWIESVRTD